MTRLRLVGEPPTITARPRSSGCSASSTDARKALTFAAVEPGMRDRLVRDEVDKRLNQSVHAERRVLEGQHARSLEELSASIAHELRNPITAAKSLVQQHPPILVIL